jgi:RNA polymerase sigma-70 factor (ECF subfamily)
MKQAYNVAYGFVRSHESAEDVAQEAFVRAHASLAGFRGDAQFGTWLYRITMNLALNHVKSRSRKGEQFVADTPLAHMPAQDHQEAYHADRRFHIERALHELPTLQRAVVILRHVEGLSTRQVSEILRCSQGTVKTHLFRGLMKMKRKLAFLREEV